MQTHFLTALAAVILLSPNALAQQSGLPNPSLPAELSPFGFQTAASKTAQSRHGWTQTYHLGRLPDGSWVLAETRDGKLAEVEGNAIPRELAAAVLPPHILQSPGLSLFARFVKIEHTHKGLIEIEGYSSNGERLEAEFSPDGHLKELERQALNPRLPSPEQIRQSLPALGYAEVAIIRPRKKHVDVLARNAQGQWMELRIKEDYQIHRERPWQR